MNITVWNTPVLTPMARALAWAFLKIMGWRQEGEQPKEPKFVLVGSPHTSNWDLPFVLALGFAFGTKFYWMGKNSLFRFPTRRLFLWLGGIPIDRGRRKGMVAQSIEEFEKRDELVLCVPPEGTRKRTKGWKTGFYYIAHGAGVPISLGFMDFKRKAGGFGPLVWPTGDIEADFATMREYYKTVTGCVPENHTLPAIIPQEERKKELESYAAGQDGHLGASSKDD